MESKNVSRTSLGIVGVDSTTAEHPIQSIQTSVFRRSSTIRVILAVMLTVYWLSMYTGTHLPRMPVSLAHHSDKLLHFSAYFGLSVLLLSWRQTRGATNGRTILRIWALVGVYGAFDELTQPIVGRDAEVMDWLADVAGAAVGLSLTWPIAIRLLHRDESKHRAGLRLVKFETSKTE